MRSRPRATSRRLAFVIAAVAVVASAVACGLDVVGTGGATADAGADARPPPVPTPPPTPPSGDADAGDSEPPCRLPSGLLGWWPGDGDLDELVDARPTRWGPLDASGGFAPGVADLAFDLDGGFFVVVPDDAGVFDLRETITLEAWIYPRTTGNGRLIDRHGSFTTTGFTMDVFNRRLRLVVGADRLQGATTIEPDRWIHVAATFDRQKLRVYVDGVEDGLGDADASPLVPGPNALRIGAANDGTMRFVGLIDEASIYDRVLTPEELQAIVDAGPEGRCKPHGDG